MYCFLNKRICLTAAINSSRRANDLFFAIRFFYVTQSRTPFRPSWQGVRSQVRGIDNEEPQGGEDPLAPPAETVLRKFFTNFLLW